MILHEVYHDNTINADVARAYCVLDGNEYGNEEIIKDGQVQAAIAEASRRLLARVPFNKMFPFINVKESLHARNPGDEANG